MRGAAGSDNNTGGALKTCASQLYDVITGDFLSTYHYDPCSAATPQRWKVPFGICVKSTLNLLKFQQIKSRSDLFSHCSPYCDAGMLFV